MSDTIIRDKQDMFIVQNETRDELLLQRTSKGVRVKITRGTHTIEYMHTAKLEYDLEPETVDLLADWIIGA